MDSVLNDMKAFFKMLALEAEGILALGNEALAPYQYKETKSEQFGIHDENYEMRLRLAYGLFFYESSMGKPLPAAFENLIRELFLEELKDRESNDFQEIGVNLEILSILLKRYRRFRDKELLLRAKNANFDCFCGYQPGQPRLSKDLSKYDIKDYIDMLYALKEVEKATEFLSIWESRQTEWKLSNLNRLRYQQQELKLHEKELETLEKMSVLAWQEDNDADESPAVKSNAGSKRFQLCSILHSYAQKLLELNYFSKSLSVYESLLACMDESWYSMGLGRSVLESGMDILLAEDSKNDCQIREMIWEKVKPQLLECKDNMHWNLYHKVILGSELIGEDELAEMFRELFQQDQIKKGLVFQV